MSILAWIEDQRNRKLFTPPSDGKKKNGLWTRCDHCGLIMYIKHLKENHSVCFNCESHLQMTSQERIDYFTDSGTWRPLNETVSPCDPLEFYDQKDYTQRLKEAQENTHLQDAVQTGTGMLDGIPIALGVMDFNFMGGSMGSVVGEKITRLIEYATQEGLTLLLVSASGGARMQEGILSLMQMAKISAALQIYQSSANLLYISILTSPTTGGVTASFAMLGDIVFAEPKALIGFAGRRVIEQTLQELLPENFQTAEYLRHHGLLDLIVSRSFLKQALFEIMSFYKEAPFRRSGVIPYGLQQNLSFVREEKLRRNLNLFKQTNFTPSLQDKESSKEVDLVLALHERATRIKFRLATKTLEYVRFAQPVLYQPTKLLSTQAEKESLVDQWGFAPTPFEKNGLIQDSSELKDYEKFKDLKKQIDFKQKIKLTVPRTTLSYRQILLSFCFISNFFLSSQSTEWNTLFKVLGAKQHMVNVDLQPNLKAQAESEDLIEETILLATIQVVEWKTFYVTQDQRMRSCANLNTFTHPNNQKDGFDFVQPTILKPQQDKTNNQNVNPFFACLVFKNVSNVISREEFSWLE